MTNIERLEYLKNIKSKELENKLEMVKAQGNSIYEVECETIVRESRMVIEEIYNLEYKISKGLGDEENEELDDIKQFKKNKKHPRFGCFFI